MRAQYTCFIESVYLSVYLNIILDFLILFINISFAKDAMLLYNNKRFIYLGEKFMIDNEFEKMFLRTSDPAIFKAETSFDNPEAFHELMMHYYCAIREVTTKLEILNDELSLKSRHSPIEDIRSRVKSPESISKKLLKKGLEPTTANIVRNLDDVAGIRVICSFVDDIFDIANMLASQDDITLIESKNYIKFPKDNGYRSLHLIVEIPIFLSGGKKPMKVEIQIRTIAMDFWASLEHQLKYKKNIPHAEEISLELKECADIISATDLRMQDIRNKLNSSN